MRQVKQYFLYKGAPAQTVKTYTDKGVLIGVGGIKGLESRGTLISKQEYDRQVAKHRVRVTPAGKKKGS